MTITNSNMNNNNTASSEYSVVYRSYTWTVIDITTNKGIVCFPTQIGAWNWISQQSK